MKISIPALLFSLSFSTFAATPYRAVCIPPAKKSLVQLEQQIEKLCDVVYHTNDGSLVFIHFQPSVITTYKPAEALKIGKIKHNDALAVAGYNKMIFIIKDQQQYPFIAQLFNQKRGAGRGMPIQPAKSLTELNAMGISCTKLTKTETMLQDARKALAF